MRKIAILSFGLLIGIIFSWLTYEGLHRTSDHNFCVICHEMSPMVISYKTDVHGGAGRSGFKAKCVDCHMPHDNIFNYIFTKAKNGLIEGSIHFFGDPSNIDWHKNRQRKEEFVYEDGCIKCHENYINLPNLNPKAKKMHEHYETLKTTSKKINCISCHYEIGHNGLRSILNYYKPELNLYKEKALKEKEKLEKEFLEK